MIVRPIKEIDSEGNTIWLSLNRDYEVLGIEVDSFRILTDYDAKPYSNDPILFNKECFTIVDSSEPPFWNCENVEEGERYCYPEEWSGVGYFEDYHDGVPEVRTEFWKLLKKYYPETWKKSKFIANK